MAFILSRATIARDGGLGGKITHQDKVYIIRRSKEGVKPANGGVKTLMATRVLHGCRETEQELG